MEAWENVKSLFRREKITIINEHGVEEERYADYEPLANPISLCRELTLKNWVFFLVGLMAWTIDGFDFHSVSLSVSRLAVHYDVSRVNITTSITLTLLFRSLGAALFGVLGDLYGRKWPMVANMILIGGLQLATAYADTFPKFLAVRAMFGIGMGGVWGNAIAMALESMPPRPRGLMSGILQQGYSLGYLLAAALNLTVVPKSKESFKMLFYVGAGCSVFVGFLRCLFPESEQFLKAKAEGKRGGHTQQFFKEAKLVLRTSWRRCIYACILMALFNFFSHTTQDSYPTFIQQGKEYSGNQASLATVIAKVGACVGGAIIGYVSQSIGRRRAIVISAILAGCLIPAWIIPSSLGGLSAGSFMLQFFVQGAWGVIPIHLNELSPPAFRSSFPGIAYQIGNMISSPSAEIVTAIAESNLIKSRTGKLAPAYGPTMGVATALIATGIAIWTAIGKEARGSRFEQADIAGHHVEEKDAPRNKAPEGDLEAGLSRDDKGAVDVVEDIEKKH